MKTALSITNFQCIYVFISIDAIVDDDNYKFTMLTLTSSMKES